MAKAKNGDKVKVHYTGKLKDGRVFDSSENREPLEFTLGEGQLIPGFEQAVVGMSPGESKKVDIPCDKAYGPHEQDLVINMDRSQIPDNVELEIGRQLQFRQDTGQIYTFTVTEFDDSSVELDANHPLSGEDLVFEIELVEIA